MKRAWIRFAVVLCIAVCVTTLAWAGFCARCGQKIEDQDLFCRYCGHKVGAPIEPVLLPKAQEAPKPVPVYENIEEANRYFELAETKRASVSALLPILRKRRYTEALDLYQGILEKWPMSDKCEASAFNIGQVYESFYFKQWDMAVKYYYMVLEINPDTTLPARLRIAKITEHGVRDYEGAAALYQECIDKARDQKEKLSAAKCLRKLREKMEKSRVKLQDAQRRP
ncbi:MAG: zinc ribbon domain-containing protein [Planctomycetota bacterium]